MKTRNAPAPLSVSRMGKIENQGISVSNASEPLKAPAIAFVPASEFGKLSPEHLQQAQYAHAAVGEVGGLSLALTIDRAWLELWHEYHKGVPFTLTAFAS